MNTEQLARATFVLDRLTAERLARISKRMGVSRSSLVRDVLEEPVALMAKWVDSMPDGDRIPGDQAELLFQTMGEDIERFIDEKQAQLTLATGEARGHG